MPRWWRRLVALMALTAFLAVNGAGMSRACVLPGAHRGGDCDAWTEDMSAGRTCEPLEDEDNWPCDSCPCEDGPGCPYPGGCMFCSVAKVPCFLPPAILQGGPTLLARPFIETNPLYS